MIHIPGLRDTFLALGTELYSASVSYDQIMYGIPGIDIESSGKAHEEHVLSKLINSEHQERNENYSRG